jgi:hypothetical protein
MFSNPVRLDIHSKMRAFGMSVIASNIKLNKFFKHVLNRDFWDIPELYIMTGPEEGNKLISYLLMNWKLTDEISEISYWFLGKKIDYNLDWEECPEHIKKLYKRTDGDYFIEDYDLFLHEIIDIFRQERFLTLEEKEVFDKVFYKHQINTRNNILNGLKKQVVAEIDYSISVRQAGVELLFIICLVLLGLSFIVYSL